MAKPQLVTQPIAQPTDDGALAPWPSIDKYPIIIGPGLSLSYISAIFRLSLVGYRQQYVDLLTELREKDPHTSSILQKRILSVAGGRLELTPPKVKLGTNDAKIAQDACDLCSDQIAGIENLEQHLASLAWASYYAVQGVENHWVRDGAGWFIERLSFIHSRRLSYPVAGSWDLYVWDQGQVLPGEYYGQSQTNARIFGLRVADAPGKFIIHAPQMFGEYPTRDALGRQLAYWMALKLIATRGAPQYLERFAKPWPEATYSTGPKDQQRPASKEDIDAATAALSAMGAGSLASWVHADTITLDLRTPDSGTASKLTFSEWITICNSEQSKLVTGGTINTEVTHAGGNRSLGDSQGKGELKLYKYDAKLLAATLKRDLISWIVRLNMPNVPPRLYPDVTIHVEDEPDPMAIVERASKGAAAGIPVDADAVAKEAGLPVVEPGDTKARRMIPIMAVKSPEIFDADLHARAEELAPEEPESESEDGSEDESENEKPTPDDGNEPSDDEE